MSSVGAVTRKDEENLTLVESLIFRQFGNAYLNFIRDSSITDRLERMSEFIKLNFGLSNEIEYTRFTAEFRQILANFKNVNGQNAFEIQKSSVQPLKRKWLTAFSSSMENVNDVGGGVNGEVASLGLETVSDGDTTMFDEPPPLPDPPKIIELIEIGDGTESDNFFSNVKSKDEVIQPSAKSLQSPHASVEPLESCPKPQGHLNEPSSEFLKPGLVGAPEDNGKQPNSMVQLANAKNNNTPTPHSPSRHNSSKDASKSSKSSKSISESSSTPLKDHQTSSKTSGGGKESEEPLQSPQKGQEAAEEPQKKAEEPKKIQQTTPKTPQTPGKIVRFEESVQELSESEDEDEEMEEFINSSEDESDSSEDSHNSTGFQDEEAVQELSETEDDVEDLHKSTTIWGKIGPGLPVFARWTENIYYHYSGNILKKVRDSEDAWEIAFEDNIRMVGVASESHILPIKVLGVGKQCVYYCPVLPRCKPSLCTIIGQKFLNDGTVKYAVKCVNRTRPIYCSRRDLSIMEAEAKRIRKEFDALNAKSSDLSTRDEKNLKSTPKTPVRDKRAVIKRSRDSSESSEADTNVSLAKKSKGDASMTQTKDSPKAKPPKSYTPVKVQEKIKKATPNVPKKVPESKKMSQNTNDHKGTKRKSPEEDVKE